MIYVVTVSKAARLVLSLVIFAVLAGCAAGEKTAPTPRAAEKGQPTAAATKAAETVDPFMGDWQGQWELDDGGDSGPLVAQVIALGKGQYQARVLASFDARVDPYIVLAGGREDSKVRLSGHSKLRNDAVDLDAQAVIAGDKFTSTFKGRQEGDGQEYPGKFSLSKTVRLSPTLGAKPPRGAIVLFDGKNFDQWKPAAAKPGQDSVQWKLVDGAMEVKPGTGSIITKREFTDCKLHLEFRTPFMPEARGQGRGNSGVYLQGRYEVQVLDSYGLEGLDNECGGIYQVAAPLVNMCAPPMQWQTYDITFRAPRFDQAGNKKSDPCLTVIHNGVKIHDQVNVPGSTTAALGGDAAKPGGIYLQDHGNLVQFRNIWLVEQN
jgi:hypothetical protein